MPVMKTAWHRRLKAILPWLAIIAAAIAAYANSLHGAFQFDDYSSIVTNPNIRTLHPAHLWNAFGMRIAGYFTFALNHRLSGTETFGYHAVNLAIHILVSCTAMALFRVLLLRAREIGASPLSERGSAAAAFSAALIFAVHPAGTQAVSYIVQRLASLTALFYLSSMLFYVSGRQRMKRGDGGAPVLFALCLISGALALFTKQNAFTLPAALLLAEIFFFARLEAGRLPARIAAFSAAALLLIAMPAAAFIATGTSLEDLSEFMKETDLLSRKEYFLTQLSVVATYLRLLLVPVAQRLDYATPVSDGFFSAGTLPYAILHASMLAAAALFFAKRRAVSFGIAFFYLAMTVESGFIPIRDLCVEHRLYLPSVGIFLASFALIWEAKEKLRVPDGAMWGAIAVTALLLGTLTHMRNEVWKTPEALWGEVLVYDPQSWRANYNLGREREATGKLIEAARLYRASVAVWPSAWAYNNLGNVLLRMGKDGEAIAAYKGALVRNYDHAPTHANLGVALEKGGDFDGARRANLEALKYDPKLAAAHYNLARLAMVEGDLEEAEGRLKRTLEIEPGHLLANIRMGRLLAETGRKDEARAWLKKALEIDPANERARRAIEEIER